MEEILRKLVAFQTVAGNSYAMHQLLDYVASYVIKRGMHVEWFESNGVESIVATVKPGSKTPKVMLAAHADVVPVTDESEFELRTEDGKYYGRGTTDMKGALAAYLHIIDSIQGNLQDYDLSLVVTGDEEIGGHNGMEKLAKAGYIPQVCILPDGGENWQVQTMSKGFWAFDLYAGGLAAHGSQPWLGINAFEKLLTPLNEIKALFPAPEAMGPDTNTMGISYLETGMSKVYNRVPEHASAILDIRTVSTDEHRRIYDAIVAICKKYDLAYTIPADGWPTAFDLEHELIAPFVRHIENVTGVTVTGSQTAGSSDVRFLAPYGTQCISFYPTGSGHHGPGEWISIKAFEQMREIIARYLDDIARVK